MLTSANNPIEYTDPLGLWQLTFGGGIFGGAQISFGNNGGFFNASVEVGEGGGFYYDFNPDENPENECPGTSIVANAHGDIGADTHASYDVAMSFDLGSVELSSEAKLSYDSPSTGMTASEGINKKGIIVSGGGDLTPTSGGGAGEFAGIGIKIVF